MTTVPPKPVTVSPTERLTRFIRGLRIDPLETLRIIPEVFGSAARRDYIPKLTPNPDWPAELHRWLKVEWPCNEQRVMNRILTAISEELARSGLQMGRFTTGIEYSDAEANLAYAIWCTAYHSRPAVVVETGVARGVTSRLVLEAMNRNAKGHLYSVDLPYPFDNSQHNEIGMAVPMSRQYRDRWTYIKGSSRRRLPWLMQNIALVDIFIHDSLHTGRNVKFELETIVDHMASGGIMIVDDIHTHRGFVEFAQEHPNFDSLICEHSDIPGSCFGLLRVNK